MKKPWALFLVLIVIAMVGFACGGEEATPSTIPTAIPPAEPTATAMATAIPPTLTPPVMEEPTVPAPSVSVGAGVDIEIGATDDLKFDKSTFAVTAGSTVILTLTNNGASQQHNWVLVENGTKDEVATAGIGSSYNGFVPENDARVFANTTLISAGASDTVTFTAPAAGTYQFVCTFPGHNFSMFGTLEVS